MCKIVAIYGILYTDVFTRDSIGYCHHSDGRVRLLWSVCMDFNVLRLYLLTLQVRKLFTISNHHDHHCIQCHYKGHIELNCDLA